MTLKEIAKFIDRKPQTLYYMKKENPKIFYLLNLGGQKEDDLQKIKKELRDEAKN